MLDGAFLHIYFFELWALADSVIKKCSQIFKECPIPEKDGYIKVDPSIHSQIASLLSEAANLKKLLAIPTKRGFKETKQEFQFRLERTKVINEALQEPVLKELSNIETRNSVEHFDQYLDRANLKLSGTNNPESGFVLYNMVLSSWKVFDKKAFPLKLYVADERKYYNLEWVADLNALHAEASDLIARLRATRAFEKQDGPGGLMVQVGKAT
jgi:hypothetical protein